MQIRDTSTASLGDLCHPHSKEVFPNKQSKPILFQIEAIPFVLSLQLQMKSPSPPNLS